MTAAVIVGYARSPFTLAYKGALARTRPDELAADVVRALVERTGIDPADIEDLLLGCAIPEGEQGLNMGRLVGMMAGLPQSVAGSTINRFCGSSMQSVHHAVGAIAAGAGDVFICAGVESMTRVPMMGFNPLPHPAFAAAHPQAYIGMGDTAENIARKWGISRQEQEAFAMESQRRAGEAQSRGHLNAEIVAINGIDTDGCLRPDTTQEDLAKLKPAFDQDGSVTAGTSSPLTDGAAAVLVTSEDYARQHGLTILARVKSVAVAGCAPEIMGIGPVPATQKALRRAGIGVDALDVIELNEAFASQSLACIRDLGLDVSRINIDGGAIALGHPLGATGARIVGKAAALLQRTGGKYALATQCIGGGQGIATVLEAA
ncbi:thiolase family protein [Allopusillimonas ginsengisoli]|uniref:thiolase family protein n=1 Tax=Allopusillimonas ginsengisoli TaxID=453575 RepID=UPI001021035B|nr:thiolase family protein [Allopusillimonas ginsengisoli]TEA76808.1 thiolase family protein [Allopusillimonas ginsengisoli]